MKKVLLTGSNGFLGTIFYKELYNHVKLTTISRTDAHINIDLSITKPILEKYDIIIHALGKAHDFTTTNFSHFDYFKNNVLTTRNLIENITTESKPECFIFISTVSVYGKNYGENINENQSLDAIDPYGFSKIQAENLLINWAKTLHVNLLILRLPLIIGKNPVGNLKSMVNAINNRYFINIKNCDSKKSFLLAKDLAQNIIVLSKFSGIYNLTSDDISVNDLSHRLAILLKKPNPISLPFKLLKYFAKFGDFFGNTAPINSKKLNKLLNTLTFSNKKAITELNWKPNNLLNNIEI